MIIKATRLQLRCPHSFGAAGQCIQKKTSRSAHTEKSIQVSAYEKSIQVSAYGKKHRNGTRPAVDPHAARLYDAVLLFAHGMTSLLEAGLGDLQLSQWINDDHN